MAFTRHPDQPDKTDIINADGVTVRSMFFRHADMEVRQHVHSYDHITAIAAGAVRAYADGALLGEYEAGEVIEVPAFVKHRFVTIRPNTMLMCIHNAERAGCAGCAGCVDGVPIHKLAEVV